MNKKVIRRLLFLLVNCLFVAAGAVLFDFHFFGMLPLVTGTDIVFFSADTALKCNIVSGHRLSS